MVCLMQHRNKQLVYTGPNLLLTDLEPTVLFHISGWNPLFDIEDINVISGDLVLRKQGQTVSIKTCVKI